MKKKRVERSDIGFRTFIWSPLDRESCELTPIQEVRAHEMSHALQKIAASLPPEVKELRIWEILTQ